MDKALEKIKNAELALIIGGTGAIWLSIVTSNQETFEKSTWLLLLGVFFRLANGFNKLKKSNDRVVVIPKLIAFVLFLIYMILGT